MSGRRRWWAVPPQPAFVRTGTDSTVWVLLGLGGLYGVLAALQGIGLRGSARLPMTASAAVTGVVLTVGAAVLLRSLRRGGVPPRGLEAWALLPVLNSLLRLVVTRDVHETSTLMLTVVGVGAAVASARVVTVLLTLACGGWVACVLATPGLRTPATSHYAAQLVVALFLGGLLHLVLARRQRHLGVARDELASVAQQFRTIFDDSPVGVGVADAEGRLVAVNAAFCRLVDRPQGELLGRSDLAYTHLDDRDAHPATGGLIRSAADGVAHLEKRYVRPDGSVRHAWLSLTHIAAPPGVAGPWTLAHAQDVTARHEAEQALRDSERNLAAVTGVARRIRAGEDARTGIVTALHDLAEAQAVAIIEPVPGARGEAPEELVITAARGGRLVGTRIPLAATSMTAEVYRSGAPVFLADPADDPMVSPALLALTGARSMMWQPVLTAGRPTALLSVAWAERVASADDRRARAVALLADETALALDHERLLQRLEQLANSDELTGLPNRRAWDVQLRDLMAQATRTPRPLVVAIADLDHFKRYNDLHGHPGGDEHLRRTAAAFRTAVRRDDVVSRWGGEEFAFALPDCSPEDALQVLERVRGAMTGGQTCSIGFAAWDLHESAEELLGRADGALYEAKRAGRDRVTAAQPRPGRDGTSVPALVPGGAVRRPSPWGEG